jgi:DUF3097, C-terminal domain/DUF3097, N-terminal domain
MSPSAQRPSAQGRPAQQTPVRSMRYDPDFVTGRGRGPRASTAELPCVPAEYGLVVEDVAGEFCGAVVGIEKDAVTLEDRYGKRRVFPLRPAPFMLEGKPVMLVRPTAGGSGPSGSGPSGSPRVARTASGSVAAPSGQGAKVARASRIYVEGRQDAELVEKIWGDDLRDVAVVVEYLGGVDDLPAIVNDFAPGPGRRLGVLVDHLVPGSKESRIAAQVAGSDVLIVGHPFIDVWAAVKPSVLGIARWPDVPPGSPWKEGVLRAIGWPPDTPTAWQRILRAVTSYADLDPAFLGRVEELIDFVTSSAL